MDSPENYEIAFYDPGASDVESDDWDEDGETVTTKRQILRLNGTRDQSIVARIVASMPDDHVAAEAYAGTGKTFLVMALKDSLRGGFTYVAPSAEHKFGVHALASAGQAIPVITTFELLMRLSRHYAQKSGVRFAPSVGKSAHKDDVQANNAGIKPIGGATVWVVMARLRKAIYAWCSSDDGVLGERPF
ncbi:hypothetical protein [Lysobacter sp. FW306-1B-D06B]|uniref:hypothetical protein n=1 Tax=Lysobacter sp. FW306-1B-D06B TaxID=3140250 RepID=UPI0031406BE0